MGQAIVIVLLIFVVIGVCSAASNVEDANKAATKKSEKTAAALRPKMFQQLFAETYPQFADQVTYSKAEAFLTAWEKATTSMHFHVNTNWNGTKWKDGNHRLIGCTFAVQQTCNHISPEFDASMSKDYIQSYESLKRIVQSSYTLANAQT